MRKATNDTDRCVACGVCALQCPREAIDIYRGIYAVVDVSKCVGCGICEKVMILVYLVQASCNTRTSVPQLSGQGFY